MNYRLGMFLALTAVVGVGIALTFQRPPVTYAQHGYRGLAMGQVSTPAETSAKIYANQLPDASSYPAAQPAGHPAKQDYKNLKVLGDVDSNEFIRLMTAMTAWVSPKQSCGYCHDLNDMSSDKLYTKVVARRMLQMVQKINADWKKHVANTGVTCWTCHRGQPVPANVWYTDPGPPQAKGALGNRAGQNAPLISPGMASLPFDPFTTFLDKEKEPDIRVVSTTALPYQDHKSIKQTEWTYALMMHFSKALGVNCTFCHNSRSFFAWDQSAPQRTIAWYGIRMVRDINEHFLEPLKSVFPPTRLGATGDVPKVNCTTCHQGASKPLLGRSMLKGFDELASANPPPTSAAAPAPASPPAPAPAAPPPAPAPTAPPPPPAAAPLPAPAPAAPPPAAPASKPAAPAPSAAPPQPPAGVPGTTTPPPAGSQKK